jgi:hypothetical protein
MTLVDKITSKKVLAGIFAAGILAFVGMTGCNSDVKKIKTKGYPVFNLEIPKMCDSDSKLELEGRFAIPVIYCKDKFNRQVACRYDPQDHAIDPGCYVLGLNEE